MGIYSTYLTQKYDCGAKVVMMHVRLGKEFGLVTMFILHSNLEFYGIVDVNTVGN
jgi:hypothetical protein